MNNYRGAMNKRDALRKEEEIMDLKLKEVGCYEEGLNIEEKMRIINFLKESEADPSQEGQIIVEEEMLECEEISQERSNSEMENNSVRKVDSPDPMIMYDSFTNKTADPGTQSSSDEELLIFDKIRNTSALGGQGPSYSAAEKNNNCYGKTKKRSSLIHFENIDKEAEMLDITGTSPPENCEPSSSKKDNLNCPVPTTPRATQTAVFHQHVEEKPLKRPKLLSENPSRVYFRNDTETREECVERILAMISEFHHKLKAYQKTLTVRIPWGPPISIDEDSPMPDIPCKRLRSKNVTNSKKSEDIYDFNTSATESSSEEVNDNDNDWIQCNKKKIIANKRNSTPQNDTKRKSSESNKCNNPSLIEKDEIILSEKEQTITESAEISKRSVKRKTFSLQKTTGVIRDEASEIDQPVFKKQRVNPTDNSIDNIFDNEDISTSPILFVRKGQRYTRKPSQLQFIHQTKPNENDHSMPSSSTAQNGISHSSRDVSLVGEKSPQVELVPCPLCQKEFPIMKIEAHASDCMVDGGDLHLLRASSEDDIVCLERQTNN